MTLAKSTNQQRVRRGFRELCPEPADSTVNSDFPNHPTLSEIATRQKEIESWEAMNVGGYRWAKPGTVIGSLICAVMIVLAVTPIPPNWPWNIPLVVVAIFTAVGTVVCVLLWFDTPDIGPRPELLVIVPFSRAENLHLMQEQAVEPFQAICTCPGCGHTDTHRIREHAERDPGWAAVTRHCGVCEREWAQA